MIKKIIRISFIPLLLIGTILTAVIFFTDGNSMTIITKQTQQIGNYTWNYYNFDTLQYLINIENSIKGTAMTEITDNMMADLPPLPNWTDILSILKFIANSFIFIPNAFIFIINTTYLLPLKLLMYPLNVLITLLGINTSNIVYVKVINQLSQMYIDYVAYV